MSKEGWNKQHLKYAKAEWIDKPTIFAKWAIQFFPKSGRLLDIGCGQGQDSRFFSEEGYAVTAIDFSDTAIQLGSKKAKAEHRTIDFKQVDISDGLPFPDASFDIVYSHLALHYFDRRKTEWIFEEIYRVLAKNGILAFIVNSTNDPEYGTGRKIEDDYFLIGEVRKYFFSAASFAPYLKNFETIILDEEGDTYKDRAVSTTNLVRFVGRKD